MIPSEARYLDRVGAAEFLGLAPSTLDKLRVKGGGPRFVAIGSRRLYDREDLVKYMEALKVNSTSEVPPQHRRPRNGGRRGAADATTSS